MRKFILIIFIIAGSLAASAQSRAGADDDVQRHIFEAKYGVLATKAGLSMGDLVIEVAKSFLGTPYAFTGLEPEGEEYCVMALDRTNCILFVELCYAFALTLKGQAIVQGGYPSWDEPSYELLCHNVRELRYRGGVVDGYPSRLHYTSEWIIQGERNNIFYEYSGEYGTMLDQRFNFMTTHTQSYRQLDGDDANVRAVRSTEQELEACGPYCYIPQYMLRQPDVIGAIRDGDIVCFRSTVSGLDIAHVGMAVTGSDGQMHFIHASSTAKKVIIETKTLADYARNGIRVIRPF